MGSLRQNPLMVPQDGAIVMSEANSGLPLKGDFRADGKEEVSARAAIRAG